MATKKIEVGLIYSAKVGGTYVPVRVEESLGHGRYQGVNVADNQTVTFATDAVRGGGQKPEDYQAKKDAPAPEPPPAADVGPGAKKARKAERKAKAAKPAKERKPSGLDAAVAVLAESGKPMKIPDVVKRMLETGLWKTGGKTPAATIYAAIIREIAVRGKDSRFRRAVVTTTTDGKTKTQRGYFELVK